MQQQQLARQSTLAQGRKGQPLESTHLLCVEPTSKQLFQINMGTQTAEEVVLEGGQQITNKIKREEYKMDQLLDRSKHSQKWFFQNEMAQNFRRQMVPFYLLEMEANLYPVYVDNSNIDESLTNDFKIKEIEIKLSDSILQTINSQEQQQAVGRGGTEAVNKLSFANQQRPGMRADTIQPRGPSNSLFVNENREQIQVEQVTSHVAGAGMSAMSAPQKIYLQDVSLLTTADKVIKKCEKEIENKISKKFNSFTFRDSQNKMQILKFKSVDSYAYGETQLIYFVEIREHLRARSKDQTKPLELVLLSLSADEMQAENVTKQPRGIQRTRTGINPSEPVVQFPPLIKQELSSNIAQSRFGLGSEVDIHKKSFQQKTRQTLKQKQKQASQIVQGYKNVSLFGWYTPFNFGKKSGDNSQVTNRSETQSIRSSEAISSSTVTAAYGVGDKFRISKARSDHGNTPFLNKPESGLIPYTADSEILKSCDIRFPLKISLLALRDLADQLKNESFNNKKETARELRLISYVAPYEPPNSDVMSLLAACQALSPNQTEPGPLRQNLVNGFANQSINKNFSQGIQTMKFKVQKTRLKALKGRSEKIFTMKPQYIQIQAALYLGCRRISTFSYSKPQLYCNNIDFSGDFLQFYKPEAKMRLLKQKELDEEMTTAEIPGEILKIDCLPSCARLCFNVILLPEPSSCNVIKADRHFVERSDADSDSKVQITQRFVQKEGFVLGSCQVSLFDESFLIRQGKRECRLWPFESFQPRMVCQGECFLKKTPTAQYNPNSIAECMTLQIEFQSFAGKVGWRLQKAESRKSDRFSNMNQRMPTTNANTGALRQHKSGELNSQKTQFESVDLEAETKSLKQVKRLLDAYPMDLDDEEEGDLQVDKVLEYRNYIHKMPIFIRLIDFTDHNKIGICYDTLDGSGLAKDMLPEESLALLDGQFGDIKVRIFAVKKLSMLNDSQIALFMPQLIQALKYELFHHSPLAEFLLEKALKNTRVVGHAFFWALKANLHWEHSRERFFLILERFLMCCGQFKNDFLKQVYVNESLVSLAKKVNHVLDEEGASKSFAKNFMHAELKKEEIRIKLMQQLVIAHAKYDDMDFRSNGARLDTLNNANRSINEELDSLADNSRRASGINSSGGEERSRRRSDKLIRSDGTARSGFEQYQFDWNEIKEFIDQSLSEICADITFAVDANEEEAATNGGQRTDKYRVSVRTQAKAAKHNNKYYQRWKVEWQSELLYIPFAPKNPFQSFADEGGNIFMSKKKPLLIVCNLANEEETEAALTAQNSHGLDYKKYEESKNGTNAIEPMIGRDFSNSSPLEKRPISHTFQNQHDEIEEEKGQPTVLKKFLFKFGDDLRQDNLVLQFFKIMDRLWQSSGDDLRMMCYDVMETGFETGYIEFVDNATVITQMHQDEAPYRGPFREKSVLNFFLKMMSKREGATEQFTRAKDEHTIKKRLAEYNDNYLHSLAGQCVATYVLGIRDRHPGNFMLHNLTGKFFHIDFGHFLGHGKKKMGFMRDREPFILSNELHYFLKYFCCIEPRLPASQEGMNQDPQRSHDAIAEESKQPSGTVDHNDLILNIQQDVFVGNMVPHEEKEQQVSEKIYELYFNQEKDSERKEKAGARTRRMKHSSPDYFEEAFEKLASQAFLKIRQNADIFINLLILMLVAGLEELDQPSISFVKRALFLNVSEEEATVQFKATIDQARKQWYRPIDNLFHVFNDNKKEKKLKKREDKMKKAKKKKK